MTAIWECARRQSAVTDEPMSGQMPDRGALWHKHILKYKIQHVSINKMLISI